MSFTLRPRFRWPMAFGLSVHGSVRGSRPASARRSRVKPTLLQHLRCPECRRSLTLRDARVEAFAHGSEIVDGTLVCPQCNSRFAVSDGIPRLHVTASSDETRPRTAASFGYLWAKSVPGQEMYESKAYHYAKMEHSLALPAPNGLVLDAGCGDGIDLTNQARRTGVEVIGVELSDGGCRTSYERARAVPRAHVVQADLCRLPFADATFDLAYSYGVLHHIGVPARGLSEVARVAKPGARIAAYLYEDFSERSRLLRWSLSAANTLRGITTQMPNRVLYNLCRLASPFVYALFTVPAALGRRVRVLAPLANSVPFRHGSGPFSLVGDLYDRFSAPVEFRYSRKSARQFFLDAGLERVTVADERGWMVSGEKPTANGGERARASAG
jgi:SAM-dependent methyltransferase